MVQVRAGVAKTAANCSCNQSVHSASASVSKSHRTALAAFTYGYILYSYCGT